MRPGWSLQAVEASAQQMPGLLATWKRSTDLQAAEAEAERLHTQRALHLSPDWSGMLRVNGLLDPEGGQVLLAAIRSLAEPANLDPSDPRTPAQAQADALVEISRRHLDGNPSSGSGSSRPQVTVTIPWDTLRTGSGLVDLEVGPITARTVRRLACDATISRIVVQEDGMPVGTARPAGSSHLRCAGPWTTGTGTAPTRAVRSRPAGVTPTTSSTGPTAEEPSYPMCGCGVDAVIGKPATASPPLGGVMASGRSVLARPGNPAHPSG